MNQTDYFTEKIATLPEDLQDAIRASNHEKILRDLQREYSLHIDQAQTLETLAIQLIFGDIDAPTFINHMFNEAHVSSAVAGDILLKIDTLILRKVREYLETIAETRKKEEELNKFLMSEEAQAEETEAEAYAEYYANVANIKKEVETELLEKGILPDGSNITDEMLAEAMGITVAELHKQQEVGAFEEANSKPSSYIENHAYAQTEKEELLKELESPEKSFVKPLFTPITQIKKTEMPFTVVKDPVIEKKEVTITLPDHQLQNTHVEIPYIEDVATPQPQTPEKTKPVLEVRQATPPTAPVIKIPTKIVLSNDPYKEPIE